MNFYLCYQTKIHTYMLICDLFWEEVSNNLLRYSLKSATVVFFWKIKKPTRYASVTVKLEQLAAKIFSIFGIDGILAAINFSEFLFS